MEISLLLMSLSLLTLIFSFVAINISLSAQSYRGEKSDHFDGQEFQNLGGAHEGKFRDLLRWITNRKPGFWEEWVDNEQQKPPRISDGEVSVSFVNHSTFLIQTPKLVILTDPVWSERVSPFTFAGPKRNKLPGIALEDVPKVDYIVLSHNHYDHLDLKTLRFFAERDNSEVICPLGNAEFLASKNIEKATDLDWWDSVSLRGGLKVDCVPAQHFSGRSLFDRNQTLWAGYVFNIAGFGEVYFAGDTGYGLHFNQIAEQYDGFRVGLIPIGAYKPEWFMSSVHISPKEAVVVHHQLNIETSIGMHFGTFNLADDSEKEPEQDLEKNIKKANRDFRVPKNGESYIFKGAAYSDLSSE